MTTPSSAEVGFSESTGALIKDLLDKFLVGVDATELLSTTHTVVEHLPPLYRGIGESFIHNMTSVVSTVTLPFMLVASSVHLQHRTRLHLAERIRAQGLEREVNETNEAFERRREEHALQVAKARMKEFEKSVEGRELMVRDTCKFLLRQSEDQEVADAALGMLLQGIVLLWGGFEVLARDLFVAHLNQQPKEAEILLKDPTTRKRFQLPKDPIELLAERGFNLANSMGSLLGERQDLSDLTTIKMIYLRLFPTNDALREALNNPKMWLINQQRHLVVHRRGVIDQDYLNSTGAKVGLGDRLTVAPSDLEDHLSIICEAGTTLLQAIPTR